MGSRKGPSGGLHQKKTALAAAHGNNKHGHGQAVAQIYFLYPQSQYGPPEAKVNSRTNRFFSPASLIA